MFIHSIELSSSGDVLAVGAPGESSIGVGVDGDQTSTANFSQPLLSSGAVYLFNRDSTGFWAQKSYIKSPTPRRGERFGESVSLSSDGKVLAVGASFDSSEMVGSGAVFVYEQSGTIWQQAHHLRSFNADPYDNFGSHVRLSSSGMHLAVASPGESSSSTGLDGDAYSNSAQSSGAVYFFEYIDTNKTWLLSHYVKASNTRGIS